MKKLVALALAGAVVLSVFCFFPGTVEARDAKECFMNHSTCRVNALNMEVGIIRTTLLLTVCDVALGRCLLLA